MAATATIQYGLACALLAGLLAAPVAGLAQLVAPAGEGGGYLAPPHDEITEPDRERIFSILEKNRARLLDEGKISRSYAKTITNFGWPLRAAAGRTDFGFEGISNYVDENPLFPNQVLDYNCGGRSYDLASGYNHKGTDIFTWPFSWNKMDDEDVVIVAGSAGTIIGKDDGHSDRSCAMSNLPWNAVYVQHADGSVAWYGHMKSGSLTVKGVGESVRAGEYLGVVGSSGSSTGPHLHLEVYDASNSLVDPWLGACNSKSKQVTWAQQRAYRDPQVNALTVGTAAPTQPNCTPGTSFASDFITAGTTVYFTMYLRDQTLGSPATMRILRPNGTVFASRTSGDATHDGSWWYWFFNSFPNLPGTWTFEATIGGKTVTKTFQVGGSAAFGAPAAIATLAGSSQATLPNTDFASPLRVVVLDSIGRRVKNAKVSFSAPSTGATAVLESRTAITDADGVASVAALANATAGSYTVTASVAGAPGPATIFLQNGVAMGNPPRLANISTRMQVLTGNDVLIGGFVIGGSAAKTVVVRGRGPSLTALGVPGALQDPVLQLFSDQTQIAMNDNWQAAANAAVLQASGFEPGDPREAAIYATLAPGAYTAIVTGAGATTGVGLVEVFELDRPDVPLVNIATRGLVLTGADVMIGGFIIQGSGPRTVVVRARAPSLASFGIPNLLIDPRLQLYSGQTEIASNDNWQAAANAAALLSSGFAPDNVKEAAILITLNPGAYTAIVTGVGGTTGVGIVEVFALP